MTKIEDFVDEVVEDNAVSVEEMATPKIGPQIVTGKLFFYVFKYI